MIPRPPRLLVIDDLFGRVLADRRNEERASLCAQLLLADISDDGGGSRSSQVVHRPLAEAVFYRGQGPACAVLGDTVENDLDGCMRVIRSGWASRGDGQPHWAMLLLDLCFYTGPVTAESSRELPGMPEGRPGDDLPSGYFGLQILRAVREEFPDLPVVVLSSKPRDAVSRAISAAGALGFIPRGDPGSRALLQEYLVRHALVPDGTGQIVGHSVALLRSLRAARRASAVGRHILMQGEAGTGKELLATYLHKASPEGEKRPWVVVDSGALTPELYASELFGHHRGAFTGAVAERTGRIAQAAGGDLFLDEIGNMPGDVQAGLLRVLQTGVVIPLGADGGRQVEVRVLSATNEDIDGRSLLGEFRSDLLDRLRAGGTILLPPLRERREDIPLLANHFLKAAKSERPGAVVRELSEEAMGALLDHEWPGNIRALEACVRGAVASHPDVEYLFPMHFELLANRGRDRVTVAPAGRSAERPGDVRSTPTAAASVYAAPGASQPPSAGVRGVVNAMRAFAEDSLSPEDLVGALPELEAQYGGLLVRLLKRALQVTSRATVDRPTGKALIHPAVRLLLGQKAVSASSAADVVKRILRKERSGIGDGDDDRLLREAAATATRLRPASPKPRVTHSRSRRRA